MIRFKHYPLLKEALNAQEKEEVSKWPRDKKALKATDHFFGEGKDEHIIPMHETLEKSEVHKKIEHELGTTISHEEYKSGKTKDKHGREVRLGAILTKKKVPPELVNDFANDSTRQGKTQSGLHILVTRSPHGVAGQTSRNQSWEQESCKNFNDGVNKKYLKKEVEHGTVVAYLKNSSGKELARSTLHPHVNNKGHRAYDVNSHYGLDHAGFHEHMNQLSKDLTLPHKDGSRLYQIHDDVYNDKQNKFIIHPHVTSDELSKYQADPKLAKNVDVHSAIVDHPNTTSQHIHDALAHPNTNVATAAIASRRVQREHIDTALKHSSPEVRATAAEHKKVSSDQLHKAIDDEDADVRMSALINPKIKLEHLERMMNDKDEDIKANVAYNSKLTPAHIDKMLNSPHARVRRAAASNPSASSENLDKALTDKNKLVLTSTMNHHNLKKHHREILLNHPDEFIKGEARKAFKGS